MRQGGSAASMHSNRTGGSTGTVGTAVNSSKADRATAGIIKVNLFGRSPPYPVREEGKEEMRFYGDWTSGLFDVEHDLTQLGCALCCSCVYLPWRINVTIDKLGTVDGVCCHMTKDNNWLNTVWCALFYIVGLI